MMVSYYTKKIYFQELSKKKILTKEEQLDCAREIEKLKKKIPKCKNIIEEEKIQKKIREIRDHLIESCFLLVVKIAKKYRNRYLSLFDLIEEGNLALIKAIDTFDYRKDIKFSTYVSTLVRNRILTVIAHRGKTVRVSNPYQQLSGVFAPISNPNQAPFQTFTRQLGVDSARMLKALKSMQQIKEQVSIGYEQSLTQDFFDKILFNRQSDKSLPESQFFQKTMEESLKEIKKILTPREHKIIEKYYGLNQQKPKHYAKIAEEMKITGERVRQLHNQGITKIKNSSLNLKLKDFLSDN